MPGQGGALLASKARVNLPRSLLQCLGICPRFELCAVCLLVVQRTAAIKYPWTARLLLSPTPVKINEYVFVPPIVNVTLFPSPVEDCSQEETITARGSQLYTYVDDNAMDRMVMVMMTMMWI